MEREFMERDIGRERGGCMERDVWRARENMMDPGRMRRDRKGVM